MEFGREKCAMLIKKSEKRHMTKGMEPPNEVKIWNFEEKKTYKYMEILEADSIKQVEMKEEITEYLRRTRQLLKTKLYSSSLIKRKILGLSSF